VFYSRAALVEVSRGHHVACYLDIVKGGVSLGHFGMAEDSANMVIYLTSPAGDHIYEGNQGL